MKVLQTLCFLGAYTGVAHFFTHLGRKRWIRVFEKYITFLKVCFGIWDDRTYDSYEFDRPEFCEETIDKEVNVDANMDPKVRFAYLIAGAISARAVVLQIAPFLTWLSVYAIAIAQAPPCVISERARNRLPDWFVVDAIEVAERREKIEFKKLNKSNTDDTSIDRVDDYNFEGNDGILNIDKEWYKDSELDDDENKTARERGVYWAILLNALIIFLTDSRAILYFYSSFLMIVAVGIIYSDVATWTLAAVIVLTPYLALRSLEMLIYTGRAFNVNDDDIKLRKWEIWVMPLAQAVYNFGNWASAKLTGVGSIVDTILGMIAKILKSIGKILGGLLRKCFRGKW